MKDLNDFRIIIKDSLFLGVYILIIISIVYGGTLFLNKRFGLELPNFGKERYGIGYIIFAIIGGYRLKMQGEKRARKYQEVENDIKLLDSFTNIMKTAHARGGYILSEDMVKEYLKQNPGILTGITETKANEIRNIIENLVILSIPVGDAEQSAAIAGIATLRNKHEILENAAQEGLERINLFKPQIAGKYLNKCKK